MSKKRKRRNRQVELPRISARLCLLFAIFLIVVGILMNPYGLLVIFFGVIVYGSATIDVMRGLN